MNAPALNPQVPLAIKVLTDLIVGGFIRNSDPKVEAARAAEWQEVGQAFVEAGNGDVTDAMTAIDGAIEAAIAAKVSDPAITAAATTGVAWVASKALQFQQFFGGTVNGAIAAQVLVAVGNETIKAAGLYIPAPAPAEQAQATAGK